MTAAAAKKVRCAVYTRKSTDEGLDQEFSTLDAQRESGENYIASQSGEGWTCLPDRYDDGGFTGGNMERPALKRLLADIDAGKVDCVIVYKVDRLSRSLLDFARMMTVFEKHGTSFVSVTQQFNTASSMGRLTLNVLLSFAQFERELISERTRDKVAAARRKGKWTGGQPILGYDIDPEVRRIHVNDAEAEQVRQIFDLYLEHESMMPVVKAIAGLGIRMKAWVGRDGRAFGGRPFSKPSLNRLLRNIVYIGKLRYRDEIHDGEHAAIVDATVFAQVQRILDRNSRNGGAAVRTARAELLNGLLHCRACDCAMVPTYTTKSNGRRYNYYVCQWAQKRGWTSCPAPSVPAAEIERLVVEQIGRMAREPALRDRIVDAVRRQVDHRIRADRIDRLLDDFDAVWRELSPRLQRRVVHLLVERVEFDGARGNLTFVLRADAHEEVAA